MEKIARLFAHTRAEMLMIGAVLAALLAAFLPTLPWLFLEWWNVPEYSHGLLMPPVAAWLIWERRDALKRLSREREYGTAWLATVSIVVILFCVCLLLLGEMKLSDHLKSYGLVGTLAALVAITYGLKGLRALAAPLFVLLLMCPIPWRVLLWATMPLKRHATVFATGLIQVSGLPVTMQGNMIHVPGIESLWVADACSGVRSLVSLVSVALLGCLFWRRHWSIKTLIVASCIPISVVVNGSRIWLTAILSKYVSPEAAKGFFHEFEGLVLFGAAALILWGWAYLVHTLLPRRSVELESDESASDSAAGPVRWPLARWIALGTSAAVLIAGACFVYPIRTRLASDQVDVAAMDRAQKSFDRLPVHLPELDLRGTKHEWDPRTIEASGADVYASRIYTRRELSFQVYLGGAFRNNDNFHSPNVCMPSQQWEPVEDNTVPFDDAQASDDGPKMRRMLLQRGEERMLVYFWFHAGDRIASSEWTVRLLRLWDLLQDKPLSPTMIASIYVPVRGSLAATEEAAGQFLKAISPHIIDVARAGD